MSNNDDGIHTTDEDFISQYFKTRNDSPGRHGHSILKSKENYSKRKSKCINVLKKKLKKYKLRKDGEEDPDVIDVSQFLSNSLVIQYHLNNNNNYNNNENIDEWRINYLTKMAKTSFKSLKVNSSDGTIERNNEGKMKKLKKKENDNGTQVIEEAEKKQKKSDKQCKKSKNLEMSGDDFDTDNKHSDEPMQMNAFMLMMGARNRSIGSNALGKEKCEEICEDENVRKRLRLKRNTKLELLSIAKGSKKNKDIEELRDENIKTKMEKRAKRLKKIMNMSPCKLFKANDNSDSQLNSSSDSLIKTQRKTDVDLEKATKRRKVCKDIIYIDDDAEVVEKITSNISKNTRQRYVSGVILSNESAGVVKKISKSDADFMSKLSPSIKKNQSVLSYFNKIEKTNETDSGDVSLSETTMKIKYIRKRKQKIHTRNIVSIENSLEHENEDGIVSEGEASPIYHNEVLKINESVDDSSVHKKKKGVAFSSHSKLTVRKSKTKQYKENKALQVSSTKIKNKITVKTSAAGEEVLTSGQLQNANGNHECNTRNEDIPVKNERRSKRVVKKPAKYHEDIGSDSESDLLLLSLQKSKSTKKTSSSSELLKFSDPEKGIKDTSNPVSHTKQKQKGLRKPVTVPTKLAPIFVLKPQISKADLEDKQRFLHSGIPDQLKSIIEKQKCFDEDSETISVVCHVQQKTSISDDLNHNFNPWTLKLVNFNLNSEELVLNLPKPNKNVTLNLKLQKLPDTVCIARIPIDYKGKLQAMKDHYPKFPLYRIFKLLKTKCMADNTQQSVVAEKSFNVIEDLIETKVNDPNTSVWCYKFRPTCTSDIIGNFEGVSKLKKWLTRWKETIVEVKNQGHFNRSDSSDSSDFYYPSDCDSRDSYKSDNVLVVTGPPGCGKTSAVYAVATELALKVIEVNSSAKRTGKIILSNLHEATQSHKVNRETTSSEVSQELSSSQKKRKNNERFKTYSGKCQNSQQCSEKNCDASSNSQTSPIENCKTGMSFILVEDADLVFEQDDGFVSALHQIVQTSKRPVILVTSSLSCPHLQRFITNGNVVMFRELSPKMLGMWLDVMCLVENGDVWPNMGQSLLELYEGDMRKAINTLQLWVASENSGQTDLNTVEPLLSTDSQDKLAIDDESSPMSWLDQDERSLQEAKENSKLDTAALNKLLFKTFISVHDHDIGINQSVLQFPVNHLNIWWNIPQLFGFETGNSNSNNTKSSEKDSLISLARLIDSISISDALSVKMRPSSNLSVVSSPWKGNLRDSVSDAVDLSSYESYVSIGDSMSYALLTSSISTTQRAFGLEGELCVDFTLPGLSKIREKEKIINRHTGLYDCLPNSCHLDRKSLAVDYLSSCREICRIEKEKSGNNIKRNNRFCHYLKSMKVSSSGETLVMLCDSLNSVK